MNDQSEQGPNDSSPKNELAMSLRQWLNDYKMSSSITELDFGIIHAVCTLLSFIDHAVSSQRKWCDLYDTIVVNPDGKQGHILFFVDPSQLHE
jgi:hypothetical protein